MFLAHLLRVKLKVHCKNPPTAKILNNSISYRFNSCLYNDCSRIIVLYMLRSINFVDLCCIVISYMS